MKIKFAAISALWLCSSAVSAGEAKEAASGTCPFAPAPRYDYYCNSQGWIQVPANLAPATKTSSLRQCNAKCTANQACKSFHYTQSKTSFNAAFACTFRQVSANRRSETSICQMYSRYLVDMDFDPDLFKPGIASDRDTCYSTDCNIINASNATSSCRELIRGLEGLYGSGVGYRRYASNYGHTSRTLGYHYYEFDLGQRGSKDTLTACGAVDNCVSFTDQFGFGSMDVYWYIPKKRWICRLYDNDISYSAYGGDQSEDYYYTYQEQHATRYRYTQKNSSIGMGFGYWREYFYSVPYSGFSG